MRKNIIDAHIHFDYYKETEQIEIIHSMDCFQIDGLITVSQHLQSAEKNLELAKEYSRIYPAFGYHPEQILPEEEEIEKLTNYIIKNQESMVAVGEVGLPYYLRREQKGLKLEAYIELLETFIILAKKTGKPIILHAIYEDAPLVCNLLEKHSIEKAHFHWFKGDLKTIERLKENGYFISVTPDVLYEKEIQEIVKKFPIEQLMAETDGPWAFEGPFKNELTHPKMIHQSIEVISRIKETSHEFVYDQIYKNTKDFFKVGQENLHD